MAGLRGELKKLQHMQGNIIRKILSYAEAGQVEKVKEWFDALKPAYRQDTLNAALLTSAAYGKAAVIDWLLKHGAEINIQKTQFDSFNDEYHLIGFRNPLERTPLHSAAKGNHQEAVRLLLERGADIKKDANGRNPYEIAPDNEASHIVKSNVQLDVWMQLLNPRKPIGAALFDGFDTAYTNLIQAKNTILSHSDLLNIDQKTQKTLSDINADLTKTLLQYKPFAAKVRRKEAEWKELAGALRDPALPQAERHAKEQALAALKAKFDSYKPYYEQLADTFHSAKDYTLDLMQKHVAALDWSSVAQVTKDKALRTAVSRHDQPLVKLLLERGASVNAKNANGKTALHIAYDPEIIKALIEKGASVNAQDDVGYTPLYSLIIQPALKNDEDREKNEQAIEILMQHQPDMHLVTHQGHTLLHAAAAKGRADLCEELVKLNVDVNAQSKKGQTALHLAAINKFPLTVNLLIAKGADVNTQDQYGNTALHLALNDVEKIANAETVLSELLKAPGLKVNVQNNDGNTALHLAAKLGSKELCEKLAMHGADKSIRNKEGKTPLEMVSSYSAKTELRNTLTIPVVKLGLSV